MPNGRTIVFVVVDEPDVRESTEELLEDVGYLVLSARSGEEALVRMRGIFGRAVAVVDLVMPGMDGWALIAAMRSDPALADVRIIVVSARGAEPVEGADVTMAKPYVAAELLAAVERLFGRAPASSSGSRS